MDKPNEQFRGRHFEVGGMAVFPGVGGLAVRETITRYETEATQQDVIGELARRYQAGVHSDDQNMSYAMQIANSRAMGGG